MIFYENGYHMMDMEFANWLYMILGAGAILLSIIVLIYVFIHYINLSDSKRKIENKKFNRTEIKSNNTEVEELGKANFCHNCGQELDDTFAKYCAYCGEKI